MAASLSEAAAEERYNRKNPAVKRILQELKEMQSNPSQDFMALPLEENIFEWQFAILGPRDTEFEGAIYHGRIQLPGDYPFNPPAFMMLTVRASNLCISDFLDKFIYIFACLAKWPVRDPDEDLPQHIKSSP